MKRKLFSLLTTLVMVLGFVGIMPKIEMKVEALGMTLTQLQSKFPEGKYWNHAGSSSNNADGYTSTPCTHHGNCSKGGVDYSGSCGCNSFASSIQCMGFANKLAYDAFGSAYTSWSKTTLTNLKAGDVIRYKNNGHSIFVTAVNGDTITYGDCNSDGHCKIMWNKTISKSTVQASLTGVYSAPGTLNTNTSQSPVGFCGTYSVGTGCIYVDGAGYDPNDTNAQIRVDVYLKDSAGNMLGIGNLTANGERLDANSMYGCGTYHGFGGYISTTHVGTFKLYVALIDATGDNPTWIECGDVTIADASQNLGDDFYARIQHIASSKYLNVHTDGNVILFDTTATDPRQQIFRFQRQSDNSYKITSCYNGKCLDSADGVDVDRSNIQTWDSNDTNAQRWFISANGNGYSLRPAFSSTKVIDVDNNSSDNGANIHLYERNNTAAQIFKIASVGNAKPSISSVKISDVTANGYKVTITATDDAGIYKVVVPTWTNYNGKDDLQQHVASKTSSNTWTYTVKTSEHGNERGGYNSNVCVYDATGNSSNWSGNEIQVGMYHLTINPNGGTMKDESGKDTTNAVKITANKLIYTGPNYNSLSWTIPTRTGYTFTGFYSAATGGTKIYGTDGKCVNEGTYFKNGNYQKASDLIVYAQWKANTYTRTLDAMGGTCDKEYLTITWGQKAGAFPTPTKTGYTFMGWYTDKTGGTKCDPNATLGYAGNSTWYAHWTANTYKKTLELNGGKCDKTSLTVTFGQKVGELPTPTKTGYKFLGWYNWNNVEITPDTLMNTASDGVFYAHWKEKGDFNKDDNVNVKDAEMLQRYLTLQEEFDNDNLSEADLNNDGKINVFDVMIIKRLFLIN